MDSDCHSIILEYLIHNCFKNTATALLKETYKLNKEQKDLLCLNDEKQWVLLDARKNLIDAITEGNIDLAFQLIKTHFPVLAAQDLIPNGIPPPNDPTAVDLQNIFFQMRCQKFIEIIRSSSTSTLEAIRYAQTHLRPTNAKSKELVKEVTALIAYKDPSLSQSKHLLNQERRNQLASELNKIILGQCNLPQETSIEKINKQFAVVTEELEKLNKPSIEVNKKDKSFI